MILRRVFSPCLTVAIVIVIGSVTGYLDSKPLEHVDMMVTDPRTGHVYAAENNELFHCFPNMTTIAKTFFNTSSLENCKVKDGLNVTAMAIDPIHPRLLVCTTFCDGLCAVYNTSNIAQRWWMDKKENGSYIPTRSVLVFLKDGDVMVGSSRAPSSDPSSFPILSRRRLSSPTPKPVKMTYSPGLHGYPSAAYIKPGSNLCIHFLSGFEIDNDTYFLTLQKDDSDPEFVSRLIYIPPDHKSAVPFIEIPLNCMNDSKWNDSLALSVDLVNWTMPNTTGLTFVVSFGQGSTISEFSPEPTRGSSLCAYTMDDIKEEIRRTTIFCEADSQNFTEWLHTNTSLNTCWVDQNINQSLKVLENRMPSLKTPTAIFHLNTGLMTLVHSPDEGVINIAVDNGTLYQISRVNETFKLAETWKYGNNSKVAKAYIKNGDKLVPYIYCDLQETCEQCLESNSTLKSCVWCQGKCTSRHKCDNPSKYDNFEPKIGPRSGGTNITFFGCDLKSNSTDKIGFYAKEFDVACHIIFRSLTSLKCVVNNKVGPNGEPKLELRKEIRINDKIPGIGNFTFEPDPDITRVWPKQSIESGGLTLTITGSNFKVIQRPQMGIDVNRTTSDNITCRSENDTTMFCKTPPLNLTIEKPIVADLYFIMDGVEKVKNPNRNMSEYKIKVFTDPYLESFNSTTPIKLTDGDQLHIKGSFEGVDKTDVSVRIGSSNCSEVDTNATTITCSPRWSELKNVSGPQNVTVRIGENIKFYHGQIVLVVITRYPESPNIGLILGVSIPSVFVLAFLSMTAIAWLCWRMDRQKMFHARLQSTATSSTVYDDKTLHAYFQLQPLYQQKMSAETIKRIEDSKLLIPTTHLKLGAPIGAGNFGCVYSGQLYSESTDDEARTVAVKTMHESNQNLDITSFVEEALIMKGFQHQNVLQLLGISVSEHHQPMVVLPYMANGDLLSYVSEDKNEIQVSDVLKWGVDIAEGMDYLSGLKLVHRDLAARNCMLDENLCAKVADFGLCRDIYEKGYYSSDNKKTLPIRWMAPESMERGNYSSKSDVWSLGVVIWEMLTRGATPYPGVEGWDIARFLHHGRRLQQPWFCSGQLYDLILQTWSLEPSLRPNFAEIAEALRTQLKSCSDQEVTSDSKDDGYVKFPECCRYVELPVPQYFVLDAVPSRNPPDDEIEVAELT